MRALIPIMLVFCAFSSTTEALSLQNIGEITQEQANDFKNEVVDSAQTFINLLEQRREEIKSKMKSEIQHSMKKLVDLWNNTLTIMVFHRECWNQTIVDSFEDIFTRQHSYEIECKNNATKEPFFEMDTSVKTIQLQIENYINDLKTCVQIASSNIRMNVCTEFNSFVTLYHRQILQKRKFGYPFDFYIDKEDRVNSSCFLNIFDDYQQQFQKDFTKVRDILKNTNATTIISEAHTCTLPSIDDAYFSLSKLFNEVNNCPGRDVDEGQVIASEDSKVIRDKSINNVYEFLDHVESKMDIMNDELDTAIKIITEEIFKIRTLFAKYMDDPRNFNQTLVDIFEDMASVMDDYVKQCKNIASRKMFSPLNSVISSLRSKIGAYKDDFKKCYENTNGEVIEDADCLASVVAAFEKLFEENMENIKVKVERLHDGRTFVITEALKCSSPAITMAYKDMNEFFTTVKQCTA